MVYVWSWPKGIPDRYHVSLDYQRSPDFYRVSIGGAMLPDDFGTLHYSCKIDKKKLRRLHVLSDGSLILVSPEIRQLLELHAKEYVQFMPVAILTLDGTCTDYAALHVLPLIAEEHLDQHLSYFQDGTRWNQNGQKKKLCHAVYRTDCLGNLPIAISDNSFAKILVSESLYRHLSAYSNTGLVTQDEALKYFLKVDARSSYAIKGSDWKDS